MVPLAGGQLEKRDAIEQPHRDQYDPMPLRIGFLMDHPSPHMVALLEAIASRRDCTLEVLYCGKNSSGRSWGSHAGAIPHRFLGGITGPMGIRLNPGILQAMDRLRVDAWVVNTVYGSLTTWMAAWWLHSRRKSWVFMNEPIRPRSRWQDLLKNIPLNFILNKTDGVIGTGEKAVARYRSRLPENCRCISVPYFIDLSDFSNGPDPIAPAVGEDLQFVSSCQMIKRKGIDSLLQALKGLPDTGWRLTLVGDGPLRSQLERKAASYIVRGRVCFAGSIAYSQRVTAFAGKHVFIFPSRWDGWGMVLPEALASGIPVVSTDQVMSAHEYIKNGENGFIVPADNPSALADKMAWFLDHISSYTRMSQAARKSIDHYRPDIGAETLAAFLRKLSIERTPMQSKQCQPLNSEPSLTDFMAHPEMPQNGHYPDPQCLTAAVRCSIFPEQASWRLLTTPQKSLDRSKQRLRRLGKSAFIWSNTAVCRPAKAKGNLILAYHLVLKEDKRKFEDHIRFFKDHFLLSSLKDLLQASASHKQDAFRLAITFDDGFRILMLDCLEILEKHGIKAGFFIPTAFINLSSRNKEAAKFSRRSFYYNYPLEPMKPEDLKRLVVLGHEVGSHGLHHTSIHAMMPESAQRELELSRSMIGEWTGAPPSSFAYPYGDIANSQGNPADWLEKAGFAYGLTLTRGIIDKSANPFALPRHHVEGNWSIRELQYFLLA
jgi:glycosyltransferase involved in cell wall biosynthesis/peptidoglycan/xylan/chitin deacetylase (PgdA/CDA1 family)